MTTVSSILKYLDNDNKDFLMEHIVDSPPRAKKRRLDHLSWEEKLQRKKLKNRVAAQTSRDRKKAKMEQMEQAIQQLFAKNETLIEEYQNVKLINERLMQENIELRNRLQEPCLDCSQNRTVGCKALNGSTERKSHTLSSGFEQRTGFGIVEDRAELPSLPDLLDELDTDVDLNSLEQLTQSLLQDIARDLEAAAQKTDCQESVGDGQDSPREVVGQPSKELESSSGSEVLNNQVSLERDISEHLLLHHNYAAKPPTIKRKIKETKIRNKYKAIRPKTNVLSTDKLAINSSSVIPDAEVVYGSIDGNAKVVTILVDSLPVGEAVTEISTTDSDSNELNVSSPFDVNMDNNSLSVPCHTVGNSSPMSSSSSDYGYESLDSPNGSIEDIWDQSVSELFPSLM